MWAEDHAIELGNAGLVEAMSHTEIRVALQKGALEETDCHGSQKSETPILSFLGTCMLKASQTSSDTEEQPTTMVSCKWQALVTCGFPGQTSIASIWVSVLD